MSTVDEVWGRGYPSYHKPLEVARAWLRDGERRADALALLEKLRDKYRHVLAVGNELVLALMENECHEEALAQLGRLEQQFREVDEETRGRWGGFYKREGGRAWEAGDLVTAEDRYLKALEQYDLGYGLRQGHYPGINKATLLLWLAGLARQREEQARSVEYLRRAEAAADEVLANRGRWPRDFADDNVWHPATAGEANLLKRRWAEAAAQYRAALREPNVQPFHRRSMGTQARRIHAAWALLEVQPEAPMDDLDALFGPAPA